MWNEWVIDASMGRRGGFCFCPVELDAGGEITSVMTGMNYLSDRGPPSGRVIAIVHEDGGEAVEAFYAEHAEDIEAILATPA